MLTIRLQRIGKKHKPEYRLVVAEKRTHVSKNVHEILGHYNPVSKKLQVRNEDTLRKYLDLNTELSETAGSILKKNGFEKKAKVSAKKVEKTEKKVPAKKAVKKTVKSA